MTIIIVSVFPIQAIALLSSASVVTDKNGAFHKQAIVYDPIGTGIDASDGSFDLGGSIFGFARLT